MTKNLETETTDAVRQHCIGSWFFEIRDWAEGWIRGDHDEGAAWQANAVAIGIHASDKIYHTIRAAAFYARATAECDQPQAASRERYESCCDLARFELNAGMGVG